VGHPLRTQNLIEKGGSLEVGQGDDLGGLHELPAWNVIHDRGPRVVDVALRVGPVRLLAHAAIEQEGNQAVFVLDANHKAAEAARHVGNLNECRGPQLLLGRGVVDQVQKFVGRLSYARHGTTLMFRAKEGG